MLAGCHKSCCGMSWRTKVFEDCCTSKISMFPAYHPVKRAANLFDSSLVIILRWRWQWRHTWWSTTEGRLFDINDKWWGCDCRGIWIWLLSVEISTRGSWSLAKDKYGVHHGCFCRNINNQAINVYQTVFLTLSNSFSYVRWQSLLWARRSRKPFPVHFSASLTPSHR